MNEAAVQIREFLSLTMYGSEFSDSRPGHIFRRKYSLHPINWKMHRDQKLSWRSGEQNKHILVLVEIETQFLVCLAYKLVNTYYTKPKVEYDKQHNAVEHNHNHTIIRKE